ncbi:MAG: ATP-binding cassette domain-containing protein, partial [Archangium sp.]
MAEPLLRIEHLGRTVDGRLLLDDVCLAVEPGEVLALVGPSGSGKSTLLRLLNRLDEPTEGTVLLEGQDYRRLAPRELRRRVGLVVQRASLGPGTVADNLRFGPRQHGGDLDGARVAELLEHVGLSGYAERDVA